MTFPKTALIFLGALLLSSCSTAASQCKQFADVTQRYQSLRDNFEADIKSSQIKASGAQNLKDVQAAATDYTAAVNETTGQLDAMIQDLGGLNLTDPQLNEYKENYVTALAGSKAALKTAGEAMQLVVNAKTEDALRDVFNDYQTKGNRAYDDILSMDAKESATVEQVNDYCAQSFE
ncbi:MAG: hypothetical protein WBA76_04855 [Phormidesmis sp.]